MTKLKVGDELAFKTYYSGMLKIWPITAITASGRLVCNTLILNPDLTIRGPGKKDYVRVWIATDQDRKQAMEEEQRGRFVNEIRRQMANVGQLTNSQLHRILEIIHE